MSRTRNLSQIDRAHTVSPPEDPSTLSESPFITEQLDKKNLEKNQTNDLICCFLLAWFMINWDLSV